SCEEFEGLVGDYLAKELDKRDAARLGAHALRCRDCRRLLEDVKDRLDGSESFEQYAAAVDLDISLQKIPGEHGSLDCSRFEELITEFLDGFVPAVTYHRFAEHSSGCDACSDLLTGVVYAVAACHSVHTYEEIEIPQRLGDRLLAIAPEAGLHRFSRRAGTPGDAGAIPRRILAAFGNLLAPARSRLAAASVISVATLVFLVTGFSTDLTPGAIYRNAHLKVASVYNKGVGIYAQKDDVEARLERVGSDIGFVWETLGGRSQARNVRDDRNTNSEPDKNLKVRPDHK